MRLPSTVATRARHDATLRLSISASVNAFSLNGCSQLSNVNPSHVVLNLLVGSLNVNTAIVISGMNR